MKPSNEISQAIGRFRTKLSGINAEALNISDYNRAYLRKYIDDFEFYMAAYSQLLQKAIGKLQKSIDESVFVDYGGGCGMLSCLAKELGFRSVIYSDIYPVSAKDAQIISEAMGYSVDLFVAGDVDEFVKEIAASAIQPDLICSFDVLEHIYNLEDWFRQISNIEGAFSLVFMTSANPYNPFVAKRIRAMHNRAEYEDILEEDGWKESDLATSFLRARKLIISDNFTRLKPEEIEMLAKKTRGLRKDDILSLVQAYLETGKFNYEMKHLTNTCDPYSGNWTEHLIDIFDLKQLIAKNGMTVKITNSYYGYSKNRILNLPKFVLNLLIWLLGKRNLFFSPSYTIEVRKPQ